MILQFPKTRSERQLMHAARIADGCELEVVRLEKLKEVFFSLSDKFPEIFNGKDAS